MSNYDPSAAPQWGQAQTLPQAQIDAGLRSYMLGVYNYMMIGLAVTGLAAYIIYSLSFTGVGTQTTALGTTLFKTPVRYLIMFSPLALALFIGFRSDKMSPTTAQGTFWLYSALIGFSIAAIVAMFKPESVAKVFFITSATFAGVSLFGYTTKKDLSGMGTFMMMGLIGLVIASVVNAFMQSSGLQWAISVFGVLIFAGLTAWETQSLKSDYVHHYAYADSATAQKSAIFGALGLYMNFVNIFQFLMSLLGDRE